MLLLDTCVLIWVAREQNMLSIAAKRAVDRNEHALFVSAITAFEIGTKMSSGKLIFESRDALAWYRSSLATLNVGEIQVSGEVAAYSTQLPSIHKDPCDRIIIATALRHNIEIVTPDPQIRKYPGVQTVW